LIRTTLRLKKGHFPEAGKGGPGHRRARHRIRLGMGPPAREAVGLSEKLGVDLLVVGSGRPRAARHALSATVWRAVLGSAADFILRSANCAVLVAHGTGVPQQFPGVSCSHPAP
jgi:Universal stress protein family